MEFFPDIEIDAQQAEAIARGLYAVAVVDGVHERELALISDFYRTTTTSGDGDAGPGGASSSALGRISALGPAALAALLPGAALSELFVKASYLLAWSDGQVSAAERTMIGEFASALGVSPATTGVLESEVKDFLLRPLARLSNVDAVTAVAKKIGA
jgi:tellurite resistance protein